FLPEFITMPVNIAHHFHDCFVVADPIQQELLLTEARQLSTRDMESLTDEVLEAIQIPGEPFPHHVRSMVQHFIEPLQAASHNKQDASTVLRQALNHHLLASTGSQIRVRPLSPQQRSIGRLVASRVLTGKAPPVPEPHKQEIPQDPSSIRGYHL